MRRWLAGIAADCKAVAASRLSLRGGWRDLEDLLVHRRVQIDTSDGPQLVLRTCIRLSGDTQTDVLRAWLHSRPRDAIQAVGAAHFRQVAAVTGGSAAVAAAIRLAGKSLAAVGTISGLASVWRAAWDLATTASMPETLANWGTVASIVIAATGLLLRPVARIWLRRKLRSSLPFGRPT